MSKPRSDRPDLDGGLPPLDGDGMISPHSEISAPQNFATLNCSHSLPQPSLRHLSTPPPLQKPLLMLSVTQRGADLLVACLWSYYDHNREAGFNSPELFDLCTTIHQQVKEQAP